MVEPIHFPDIELYRGWGEPMRSNIELRGLELVSGAVPDGLEGALYRVGADRQYPSGRTDDIFIDGEGQMHMLRIKDNQVDYVVKWVETERYKRQKAARRGLFGRYRNRYTVDESVKDHRHVPCRAPLCAQGGRSAL
jgi:carotenoid cleavage dioxygenase